MKIPFARSLCLVGFVPLGVLAACGHTAAPAAAPAPVATDTSALPASSKVETKSDPAFASCHSSYKPPSNDKDVVSDVAGMAKGCADVTKMKKVGDTLTGKVAEKATAVTFPLSAQAGKCYRIYGVSQSTMQDFDLTVVDSTGALVAQDTTDDVSPVIAEDGKVCFKTADTSTVRASAGAGAGDFALEVWSD